MSENLVIEIEFHAVVLTSFHPFAYNKVIPQCTPLSLRTFVVRTEVAQHGIEEFTGNFFNCIEKFSTFLVFLI